MIGGEHTGGTLACCQEQELRPVTLACLPLWLHHVFIDMRTPLFPSARVLLL